MSAAATAAGYLYASGRLRTRSIERREEEKAAAPARAAPRRATAGAHAHEPAGAHYHDPAPEKRKSGPRIEYRVRRWRREE